MKEKIYKFRERQEAWGFVRACDDSKKVCAGYPSLGQEVDRFYWVRVGGHSDEKLADEIAKRFNVQKSS